MNHQVNRSSHQKVPPLVQAPTQPFSRLKRHSSQRQIFPAHYLSETLKRIHAAIASAAGKLPNAAPALQMVCREVASACAVDAVQFWLVEEWLENAPASSRLALRASSEGCVEAGAARTLALGSYALAARVLSERRGRCLNNLAVAGASRPVDELLVGAASALLVPLVIEEQPLGIMVLLDRCAPARFAAEDLEQAELLAGHVALAVQHVQLLASAQSRAAAYQRGLSALTRASEVVAATLEVDEVSQQIVAVVRALPDIQAAWLMVYDEEVDLLRLAAISGWEQMRPGTWVVPGKSVAGEVFLTGRPMFVPDVQAEPLFSAKQEAAAAGIVAMLGLPLFARERVVGVLGMNPAPGSDGLIHNPLDGPDGEWLRLFAAQAGMAIEHASRYEQLQTNHAFAEQLADAAQRHAGEMETIFESMAEGVAVFDAAGQVVRLNRAGAALAGISSAPLLVVPPTALGTGISADLAGRSVALAGHSLVLRALAGEVVTGEEVDLTREDGVQVSLRVSVAPLFGEKGQVTGAVAILEDVTEQRQRQREQLAVGWVAAALNHPLDLKETLDTAVEALTAALGADHSAILLADGAQAMLRVASARGYAEDAARELAQLPIEASLAPCIAFRTRKVQISQNTTNPALNDDPLSRLLWQSGVQASLAAPLLMEDQTLGVLLYSYGQPHHFSIDEQQVARAIADQIALAVVNARLYEEVADYAAWQENERRVLQAVIDALPAGVTLRDKTGKLFIYNQAALRLAVNYSEVEEARRASQAPVEPVWQVIGPDGAPDERAELPSQVAVETGELVRAQISLRQSDGRVIPVLVNAAPVRDADGNLTRGVAVFQDITALKELERHKDEFISVASHELRGPLTVIRGQAQLLLRQLRRQEKQGELSADMLHILESVESIEVQTARLNDLVNDLLDVSRIQSGKLTLHRGPVDLMTLVSKVVQHWKPASASHTLILEAMPTGEVVGYWDGKRVEQILNNLLGNAVKYSPEGGKVTVRVQVDSRNKQALLEVQDEGMGIPPEASSHLFERFYRAGNVSNISGTGLGLYISRQLATAHGGDLWASSPGLEQGSTFTVRLPLQ